MGRIVILIILFFVGYSGYNGMKGNKDLVEYSIEEIEKDGVGENRFVKIKNGFTLGNFVYDYSEETPDEVSSIIFPLVSEERVVQALTGSESVKINVLIKRNSERYNRNCLADTSCIADVIEQQLDSGYTVMGTSLIGLDDIDEETKNILNTSGYNLSGNVLFLEEDSEPQSYFTAILKIIGAVLGAFLVIGSFLRKFA